MNEIFLWALSAVSLAVGITVWARHVIRKRHEQLRKRGYELIACLKAYAAWVDYQDDDPIVSGEAGESALPEPLARACVLKDAAFPGLAQHMVRLLQAHSRLIEYLWHRNLLRLSQASGWRPPWQDRQYQQIRGAQEDLIQEMIGLCQETIGDRVQEWRRTGTDFCFTGSTISTPPGAATGA